MTPPAPPADTLPPQPFFHTAEQRRALARQRFFDEGQRPTGLVPDAVIQSWTRCVQARRDAAEPLRPATVSALRLQSAQRRHRALLAAAAPELAHLQALAAGRGCHLQLLGPDGVVLRSDGGDGGGGLLPAFTQPGTDVSEPRLGTTAPAVALRSGQPCAVQGREHFFEALHTLRCAAAPVHDGRGQLAGALNLSLEGEAFGFDALAVVATYAGAIGHRLAQALQRDGWLLRFHVHPDWVDTPGAALAGLDDDGRVRWCNEIATHWLPDGELAAWPAPPCTAAAAAADGPCRGTLPNGLPVWWRLQRGDGRAPAAAQATTASAAPAAPEVPPPVDPGPPPTLAAQREAAIVQALRQCRGNVSRAARLLGISRGAVYRHAGRRGMAPSVDDAAEVFRR